MSRVATDITVTTASSGSSGSTVRPASEVKIYRLVIFLLESPARILTINCKILYPPGLFCKFSNRLSQVTNKFNRPRMERTGDGIKNFTHITFTAVGGNFHIGNFSSKTVPGIPLNPATLASRENFHVDWVELEFKDPSGMCAFLVICQDLTKSVQR